jgi:flagellar basal-body rod modification protein FlgD
MNISGIGTQQPGAAGANATGSTNNNSNSNTPNNTLNGNAFITLLTAQLQAQDPMNPMDPNQMVDELVSLNSLQQLIEIQNDLSGGANASTNGSTNAAAAQSQLFPGAIAG